jgi:hypothetical protein
MRITEEGSSGHGVFGLVQEGPGWGGRGHMVDELFDGEDVGIASYITRDLGWTLKKALV